MRAHPPRLEYIARADQDPRGTCDWEWVIGPAACRKAATVYTVEWDGYEWIAHALCRRHGNPALGEMRKTGGQ